MRRYGALLAQALQRARPAGARGGDALGASAHLFGRGAQRCYRCYAGFNELFAGNRVAEAACWAHPWTAPGAQGKNTASLTDYGRVQPSIRPGVAARWPQALMIFAAPFPITGADFASDAPNGLDG